ncbi:MAG: 50S ribosomal protein L11 methyltransferase [Pseudomonadota bacterium]
MFKVTSLGPQDAIQAAWDALAWADPTPAEAVDAKEEGRTSWRLDAYAETEEAARACVEMIETTAPGLTARYETLEDRDWVTLSLEGLPPVEAGPFLVAGSHALTAGSPGKISVLIEAGPAFGSGHHGTTLGCLLALDKVRRNRKIGKVLDLGTGSGVLAIAALKTGAIRAIGSDLDADSIIVARENAAKNHVAGSFKALNAIGARSRLIREQAPYQTVFANILAKPLISLAPDISRLTAPGGTIILSGLLEHQEPLVRSAFLGRKITMDQRIRRDGWSTLVFRKPMRP